MNPAGNCDFVSLAEEQEFWNRWIAEHDEATCLLGPFLREDNQELWKEPSEQIRAITKVSEVFLLIMRTNIDNGVSDLTLLVTTRDGWQQMRWKDTDNGIVKESVTEAAAVPESLLKPLTGKAVIVDVPDHDVYDADSIYMFLKYRKKYSRCAVYHPQFDNERKARGGPVTAALEALLRRVGMAEND